MAWTNVIVLSGTHCINCLCTYLVALVLSISTNVIKHFFSQLFLKIKMQFIDSKCLVLSCGYKLYTIFDLYQNTYSLRTVDWIYVGIHSYLNGIFLKYFQH